MHPTALLHLPSSGDSAAGEDLAHLRLHGHLRLRAPAARARAAAEGRRSEGRAAGGPLRLPRCAHAGQC